jgi:ribosome assembly protein 3
MADGRPESTGPAAAGVATEFKSYYLQRATQEFAEDLDRVRGADDFKADGLQLLVHALGQGTRMFTDEKKMRVLETRKDDRSRQS